MSAALLSTVLATAEETITVNPTTRYQTWEGWGTSLCWWAHIVGGYPEPLRSTLVDKVLGELKINIVRYNIGGGENPGIKNAMEPRARVPGYLKADGTYDWTADAAQRWVLDRAIELGANKLEAFSNSPPYFMTISGSVTGAHGGGNNLKPECDDDFAEYMAVVVKQFRDVWGIKFQTLAPMNEPAANWWKYGNRQEGCHISPGRRQSEVILATQRALKRHRLTARISATEESVNDWAVTAWDALTPLAKSAVWQFNTHCYGGKSQKKINYRASRDAKRLWMSEYGDGDATGLTLARQIVLDIRDMKPTAWVYWQVIDAGGGWGMIDMDINKGSHSYKINRKFYNFSQFSQWIRPGYKFIEVGDSNTVAAVKGSRLVLVTVTKEARTVRFDLSRFTSTGANASVTRTSPTENLQKLEPIPVADKAFTAELPADSVTTFVVDRCQ